MPEFTDQLGRTIHLPRTPCRIISLVPSQTELLYSLGLEGSVVGITRFCVHPESWFHQKSRIGGTKAVNPSSVGALQPDLIIAGKEENERPQVEALAERYPVWVSDVKTLDDALQMIRAVGGLTGTAPAADALALEIDRRFATLGTGTGENTSGAIAHAGAPAAPETREAPLHRVIYLIWRNPWMAAGGDTFIHQMLRYAGFSNVFAGHRRYPEVDLTQFAGQEPLTILLSTEPYPFRERHIQEIREMLPQARILLVDGEMFSWYGSRLLLAPAYFRQLREQLSTNNA